MKVETYGNHEVGVGTSERPLVSMLLLAYNQEATIAEAIEGAFAQTYSPLEIILSDDCSPDDATFAVMERMAHGYEGPHKVLLVQRERNLGLIGHINELLELASAEIMVLSAGDDICLPQRTERLAEVFRTDPAALVVHSDAVAIDMAGAPGAIVRPPVGASAGLAALATSSKIYVGATGAVRRDVLRTFGPIAEPRAFEDLVMGFRAALLGGLRYIPEVLLQYRTDVGISSEGSRLKSYSRLRLRYAEIMLATLRQRQADLRAIQSPHRDELDLLLHRAIARFEMISSYHDPAAGASGLAYGRKIIAHGWPGMLEALRHLRFELRRRLGG